MNKKGKAIYIKWDKAIKKKDLKEISILLTEYPKLINQGIIHYRGNGTTFQTLPLNMVNDSIESTKLLVEKGADPNGSVKGDGSALIQAVSLAPYDQVELLIRHGADVNKGVKGDGNPLIKASRNGRLNIVKLLVQSGAEIDAHVIGDETPLIGAAWSGHLDIVKYLVEQGADVHKTVRDGYFLLSEKRNAIMMARRGQHQDVVDYLLSVGERKE